MFTNNWITTNIKEHYINDTDLICEVTPYKFTPLSFDQAAIFTARKIQNDISLPLYISFSGGADSEFIVRLFHNLKIPFTPLIVDVGINKPEVAYAYSTCEELKITPKIVKLTEYDVINYFYNVLYKKYKVKSLYFVPTLIGQEIVTKLNGFSVTGYGFTPDDDFKTIQLEDWKFNSDLFNFNYLGFFYYTIEMAYACINEIKNYKTIDELKSNLYKTKLRPKYKTNYSSESLKIYYQINNQTKSKFNYSLGSHHHFEKYLRLWSL